MQTSIISTADLHGRLPNIPECDILTISGDVCPAGEPDEQAEWLERVFAPWLREQPVQHTVATWGNHDLVGYAANFWGTAPVTWLIDELTTICGIRFFGTPWTRPFGNTQAFMVEDLGEKFQAIQPCDVLICHSPPYGFGDKVVTFNYPERCGSPELLRQITERHRPQLVVYGHIHPGNGVYDYEGLVLANVAAADKFYEPTQPMLRTVWIDNKLAEVGRA